MNSIAKLTLAVSTVALFAQSAPGVAQTAATCDYTNANLYDGWGWDPVTRQSCAPQTNTVTQPSVTAPSNNGIATCQLASDADGDGWGWENNSTCQVRTTPQPSVIQTPSITQPPSVNQSYCDDSDGDGWGWDGTASCRVNEVTTAPVVTAPVVTNPVITTPASECIDSDGDGYGWDGTASCIVTQTTPVAPVTPVTPVTSGPVAATGCNAPPSGSVFVSSNNPVRSTGNPFFPDRGPQCVSPENQFNGPGLGFGDFLLVNNAWNGDKSTYNWSQCIALSESNGVVSPSWTYDWGNEDDLQPGFREWEVKSYPELLYGVKSQTQSSASCEETGLPVTVSQMPQIDVTYSYTSTQTNNRIGDFGPENNNPVLVTGGDRNIAMESFLHTSCDIQRGTNGNREFELMVWLDVGPERLPTGSPPVSVYTDAFGRSYDVYVKGAADPGYIAYVAQQEQTSGNLDWNAFFADAQTNAATYGVKRVDDNWCLANILFGTEIWWGEGSLSLDQYEITRSY